MIRHNANVKITIIELIERDGKWYGGECPQGIFFVNPDANGSGSGKSSQNAMHSLRLAIDRIQQNAIDRGGVTINCESGGDTEPVIIDGFVTTPQNCIRITSSRRTP